MSNATRSEAAKNKALANYDAACIERPMGERWVAMQNGLTRAAQGLTLAEKRIVMIGMSMLDSRRAANPAKPPVTRITAAEYAEHAQCEMSAAYEALQTAAKNLYNRSITVFQPSHKRGRKRIGDKGTVIQMRWVGRATYHEGEAWIELAWWHEVLPYLTGLQKQFTKYQLGQAAALRSVYSWRLLELLSRFQSTGKAEYTIEDFKKSMDAPPSLSDFAQVKRRIIEPAVKELTEKDGWLIQWEPIKRGRRVASVRFTFMRDPQGRLL